MEGEEEGMAPQPTLRRCASDNSIYQHRRRLTHSTKNYNKEEGMSRQLLHTTRRFAALAASQLMAAGLCRTLHLWLLLAVGIIPSLPLLIT